VCALSGFRCALDVLRRAVPKLANLGVIFFLIDVGVRLLQRFDGAQQAASVVFHVDGRMIVKVLAVINRSAFDLGNRGVDFLNRDILVRVNLSVAWLVI
jgi:hypothetical protein